MEAKMDRYGTRGLLGNGETETIPIRATQDGSLCVTESGTLSKVVTVDLSAAHDGDLIYEGEFSELTFAIVGAPVKINIVDDTTEKYMTIAGKTSISASGTGVRLKNTAATGCSLEVWIWR